MHENAPTGPGGPLGLRTLAVVVLLGGSLALGLRALLPATSAALNPVVTRASGDLALLDLVIAAAYLVGLVAALVLAIGGIATALSASGRGSSSRAVARCVRLTPTALRRLVLVACGAALTVPLATGAGPGAVAGRDHMPGAPRTDGELSGLTLPDLPTAPWISPSEPPAAVGTVLVRSGDSLWSITSELLGSGATPAQIAHGVDELHQRNLHVIGANPDLILPGTQLTLWRNR